jgi:hypothetical protein
MRIYVLVAALFRIDLDGCGAGSSSTPPPTEIPLLPVQSRNWTICCKWPGEYMRSFAWILVVMLSCALASLPNMHAATLKRDSQAKSMQGVTDVTGGMRYLLRDDDLLVLEVRVEPDGSIATSLLTSDTSNSQLGTPVTTPASGVVPGNWNVNNNSVPASVTTGRMFATKSNIVATLSPQTSSWIVTIADPLTAFNSSVTLASAFQPHGAVFTQILMGDFLGNRLDEPLAFYASDSALADWGLKVLYPSDSKTEATPSQGPELHGDNGGNSQSPVPVTGSFVTGDFNGDGRDEIAALLTDYQTIVFYSVDPTTYKITQVDTLKLPQALTPGQATIAAGRFRNTANAELVAVGQIQGGSAGLTIYSIQTTSNGAFNPSVVQNAQLPNSTGAPAEKVLAQAASIKIPMQTTNQQLMVGISDPVSVIDIGSFGNDKFNFTLESISNLATDAGASGSFLLQSMSSGNFDNRNADGTNNPALQLETLAYLEHHSGIHVPQVTIFNFNPPEQTGPVTDWLAGQTVSYNNSGYGNLNGLILAEAVPGDVQGRSLRLGTPDIVTVYQQIQPDIVLGIPPMHVDYVKPAIPMNASEFPGCDSPATPCELNISVKPSVPPSISPVGFATSFTFSDSTKTNSSRKSTTSWGVSVKNTDELYVSYGDELEYADVDIKNSAQYAHDNVVSKTYNTFQGTTDSLTTTTGFADHILYTQRDLNIYYYPVLGRKSCPSSEPDCPDNDMQDVYVEFSVPDQVTHADVDGTTLDWYQPVHEPGNVLSYPWSFDQVENQFVNTPTALTQSGTCGSLGSGGEIYSTTWTGTTQTSQSSGSSNAFSDDLSISTSFNAGEKDIFSVNSSLSVDIGASASLSTLNEDTSSLSASSGFQATRPSFDDPIPTTYDYDYAGYILGQKNKNPAYQSITVNDPNGNPANLQSTGPLTVAYLADVVPDAQGLDCGGVQWWRQVYNTPDIAVNHPSRWNWSKSQQHASFNKADPSSGSPLDQPFYQMKGFFITQARDGAQPTLSQAVAGEPLNLSARIYNFSLVDTNSSTLANPAASIHVRFYGQLFCQSGSDNSCKSGCTPGNLCDDAFLIGETTLASIPGFKSANFLESVPNWAMTQPVTFDTTMYPGTNLVFWVVTWMEDAKGNLVSEMPGHGLTANPRSLKFTQITQVPVETYSNNVGLYGANTPFYICATDADAACVAPSAGVGAGAPATGALKSVTVSTSKNVLLDSPVKVVANLQAQGGAIGRVNVAYYDGDPANNGQLFDLQTVTHMDPDATYVHRAFFHPETCGVHKLYAMAWSGDSPEIQSSFSTNVGIDSVNFVQTLINATQAASITDSQLSSALLVALNMALQDFQQNQTDAGNTALGAYMQQLTLASGQGISAGTASQLAGQADVVLGCGSTGFSLALSPPSATVSAGSPASYALAVTPIGGFTGKVTFACLGASQAINCSFSAPSVNLDGSSQSNLTITVTAGGKVSAAGLAGPSPSILSARIKWLLLLLLAALATASLQRARVRQTILACAIALVVLGGISGCGSGNGGNTTLAPGTYPFTLQATSGGVVRNTLVTLVVK